MTHNNGRVYPKNVFQKSIENYENTRDFFNSLFGWILFEDFCRLTPEELKNTGFRDMIINLIEGGYDEGYDNWNKNFC